MPQTAARRESPFTLGRRQKLLNGAQFKAVFDGRSSIHGVFFSIHVLPNNLDYPRIGITVSKKVSKRAVQRNRIKRQIRESFRLIRGQIPSVDIVVVSKPGSAEQDNVMLRTELDNLWHKTNQKCEKYRRKS